MSPLPRTSMEPATAGGDPAIAVERDRAKGDGRPTPAAVCMARCPTARRQGRGGDEASRFLLSEAAKAWPPMPTPTPRSRRGPRGDQHRSGKPARWRAPRLMFRAEDRRGRPLPGPPARGRSAGVSPAPGTTAPRRAKAGIRKQEAARPGRLNRRSPTQEQVEGVKVATEEWRRKGAELAMNRIGRKGRARRRLEVDAQDSKSLLAVRGAGLDDLYGDGAQSPAGDGAGSASPAAADSGTRGGYAGRRSRWRSGANL